MISNVLASIKSTRRRRGYGAIELLCALAVAASTASGAMVYAAQVEEKSTVKDIKNSFVIVKADLTMRWEKNQAIPEGDLIKKSVFVSLPGFIQEPDARMTHKWNTGDVEMDNVMPGTVRFALPATNSDKCRKIAATLMELADYDVEKSMVFVNKTLLTGTSSGGQQELYAACDDYTYANSVGLMIGKDGEAYGSANGYKSVGAYVPPPVAVPATSAVDPNATATGGGTNSGSTTGSGTTTGAPAPTTGGTTSPADPVDVAVSEPDPPVVSGPLHEQSVANTRNDVTQYGHAKTIVTLLLDRSGSMEDYRTQTVDALNTWVSVLKDGGEDIAFSLYFFNSFQFWGWNFTDVDKVYSATDIADVNPITYDQYQPSGGTPLYDATRYVLGQSDIELAAARANGENVRSVFAVQSDGADTTSRSSATTVRNMINNRTDAGWQFTFLAAGEEAKSTAENLGFQEQNILSYGLSADETKDAFYMTALESSIYAAGYTDALNAGSGSDNVWAVSGEGATP